MRSTLLLLSLALAAIGGGCQGQVAETTATEASHDPLAVPYLTKTDTLPYPVVAKFDDLAELFQQDNDTVYVINFWATWCAPCVEELPNFEKLAAETSQQPVQLIMISLDFKRDIRTKLLDFVRDRPLELPVVALTDSRYHEWIDRVDPEWTGAIPITLIYKGDQRQFYSSAFARYEDLAAAVAALR